MNNKGFTLIELLVTIVLLTIVTSIAGFSIVTIMNDSRRNNYEILLRNIMDGAEAYYQECRYSIGVGISANGVTCNINDEITLNNLVSYGFIKGNATDSNKNTILVNPLNDNLIGSCTLKIIYDSSDGKIKSISAGSGNNCPTKDEYNNLKIDNRRNLSSGMIE